MNNNQLTFQELKSLVSVIDVACYLGYKFDRSKGIAQPSFVRYNNGGIEDRIYIKNPNSKEKQGYWRRTGYHTSGDLISFVREHLDEFNVSGNNEIDRINKILHKFAGREFTSSMEEYKSVLSKESIFDPSRWEVSEESSKGNRILSSRKIDRSTVLSFSRHIHIVQDKKQEGKFTYVGFPYTVPGTEQPVGYELRGYGGFKSKAAGTDSTNAMWIASFTDNPLSVKEVYIAESAFDALSFYQLHRTQIDLKSSVFVSMGGSFSDRQFSGLLKQYPAARMNLLFDNDLNGHMYDIRALSLMNSISIRATVKDSKVLFTLPNKSFEIDSQKLSVADFAKEANISIDNNRLIIYKPHGNIKDWNDVLKAIPDTPSKYQFKR
ncbi:toprim domain-containing protein [Bacteroides heparinolyticus]|uniref:toprim domain-containing protein n=1 Tax=Prevotella heparinolytica TaxID=28113 RepID=UPI0035A125FA